MKRRKEKKACRFSASQSWPLYLKPYKMLFFWMVVTGTVGSGMDAIIPCSSSTPSTILSPIKPCRASAAGWRCTFWS